MRIVLNDTITLKTHKLGAELIKKRGRRGLRTVARETGVHHATWQRVEQGAEPSMETFKLMMKWLNIPADKYLEFMDFKAR